MAFCALTLQKAFSVFKFILSGNQNVLKTSLDKPFTKLLQTTRYALALVIPLLFLSFISAAQIQTKPVINSTLKGKVIDAKTRENLLGVSVQIKGTTNGAVTDGKGEFNLITGQIFPYTLVVSYIGYEKQELVVSSGPIQIELKANPNQLNDVVVVGYGVQRRKDITGSVASVPKEALSQVSPSVDNLLRGAVSGVNVTQSSGQPGASATIRIRGGNSITAGNEPLYVIDGFPIYNDNSSVSTGIGGSATGTNSGLNALATINPGDIESIDILKDASATAIYGSRGANGVVIITTKLGKRGTQNVTYNTYFGQQKITKQLSLLNGTQWAQLYNDVIAAQGAGTPLTATQISTIGNGSDWQNATYRTAPVQNHDLSFSGGDEKSRFAVSGNYFKQQGITINTDFSRYSARFNYERSLSSKFKIGLNATGSRSTSNGVAANTGALASGFANLGAVALSTSPAVAIKSADGTYNVNNPYSAGYSGNPIQDLNTVVNETNVTRTLGNFFGEYNLLQGLVARVSFGADLLNTRQNYFAPKSSLNGSALNGTAAIGNNDVNTWLNENTLTYSKAINTQHTFSVLLGYTTQYYKSESVTSSSSNFLNESSTYNKLDAGSVANPPSSSAYSWALNSYLARINYSYLKRYNFTLSARADGSSKFGSGKRWGYFPSAGFSWNIADEDFLKDNKLISNLKLRLSAGATGNQEIGVYNYLTAFTPLTTSLNGTFLTAYIASQLGNEKLKWEKTTQYNIGTDIGLFDNRIVLTADAYYKKTTDLLLLVSLPLSSGFSTALQNVGAVSNKGIELGINTDNIRGNDFTWKTSLVYSLNRNEVLSLGSASYINPSVPTILSLLAPVRVIVGQPLGTFWGFKTDGIFQNQNEINNSATSDTKANTKPGDQKYKNLGGDPNIITANDDKTVLGSSQPKFTGSLTNTFTYQGFDLLVFLQGSYGNKIYNALKQQLNVTSLVLNSTTDVLDRWTPANPSNSVPRASNQPTQVMSDRYIEDGSYLRLKTLTLGYTVKQGTLFNKAGIKSLRFYLSAQNLATWTKYTGYDPEASSFEQNPLLQGIDYGAYPNYRTFLAGLNITL
ncbi:TonB-dependent receptor plug [Mucilaginibacter paludis DSM 18603]|uniref:TonB-dependent receptor plug n=2 Tax=Mucilaginibacter TaxID=423349 RepID=H1Y5A5_9SPHI|nr:TonB-dependent receptor plug [Mucilaginibacter paludis DSM 18603]